MLRPRSDEETEDLLADTQPFRYQQQDGRWRCPPGEEYAAALGLSYRVRSSAELPLTLIDNLAFLEDYLIVVPRIPEEIAVRVLARVRREPGISLAALLGEEAGVRANDVIEAHVVVVSSTEIAVKTAPEVKSRMEEASPTDLRTGNERFRLVSAYLQHDEDQCQQATVTQRTLRRWARSFHEAQAAEQKPDVTETKDAPAADTVFVVVHRMVTVHRLMVDRNAPFPLLDRFPQSEGAERVAGIPAHRTEIHRDAVAATVVQTGTEIFACG